MQAPGTRIPATFRTPAPPQEAPRVTAKRPSGPSRGRWLAGIAALLAAAAGALWYAGQRGGSDGKGSTEPALRSFAVVSGTVEQTLRLTGTTAAERYVSLIAPQLRGSRSGFGRSGSSVQSRSSSSSSVGALGGSVSSTGGGSSASASSATSSLGSGASGGGTSGGGTSVASTAEGASAATSSSRSARAMGAATSRVSRSESRSRAPRASSGRSSGSGSATLGAEGLGSTAASLPGGSAGPPSVGSAGGGRGGRGEFSLVLQEAARPGSFVRKGEVVAEFDRQNMLLRLDDYRATVIQTEAALKGLKADQEAAQKAHQHTIDVARADLDKARLDMQTTEVVSAIEAEKLRLNLEEAQARLKQVQAEVKHFRASQAAELRQAELELKQAQLELRRAEANADRMLIKAPIDGLVVMQNTFRGGEFDQIKPGDQLFPGQPFMQIVDPSSMIVNATVNQADVERLRIGQRARVRFDAFPDLELPARVYAIGTVAKSSRFRADWVKEMAVALKLEQMDPRVIPDLSVSADVILHSEEAPAIVPREAITQNSGEQPYVWARAGSRWERRTVELGVMNNTMAAVRAGLREGDVIALEPPPASQGNQRGET